MTSVDQDAIGRRVARPRPDVGGPAAATAGIPLGR